MIIEVGVPAPASIIISFKAPLRALNQLTGDSDKSCTYSPFWNHMCAGDYYRSNFALFDFREILINLFFPQAESPDPTILTDTSDYNNNKNLSKLSSEASGWGCKF